MGISRAWVVVVALGLGACSSGSSADGRLDGAGDSEDAGHTTEASADGPVRSDGGTVSQAIGIDGGNIVSADGRLTVHVPPRALDNEVSITLTRALDVPAGSVGPAYELGPSGIEFESPVQLAFQLDPAELQDVPIGSLRVATVLDGGWQPLGPAAADRAAGLVVGQITHFSPYGLVVPRCSGEEFCFGDLEHCLRDPDPSRTSGFCAVPCATSADCPDPLVCRGGACTWELCGRETACRSGFTCDYLVCRRPCTQSCSAEYQWCSPRGLYPDGSIDGYCNLRRCTLLSPCQSGNVCTWNVDYSGERTFGGACLPETAGCSCASSECPCLEAPDAGVSDGGTSDGGMDAGPECMVHTDCATGEACAAGECMPCPTYQGECSADGLCDGGATCEDVGNGCARCVLQ